MGAVRLALPEVRSERQLNRRYLSLVGLQEFAILLPLSVLVLHMMERGLGLEIIGLAFGIRALTVALLEIPTGGLADSIGRKPTALWSQALTLLSMVVLLFVTSPTTALVYAVLQGLGAALHSGALSAWYIDTLKRVNPAHDLQQNLARIELVRSVCMVSTFLGGLLPVWALTWALPWPLANFGISLFVGIMLRVLVWILTLVFVSEPEFEGRASLSGLSAVPGVIADAAELIRSTPVVRYLLLSAVASGVALISLETFWQPVAGLLYGVSPENGGVFGVFGLLTAVGLTLGSLVIMRIGSSFPGGAPALAGVSQLLKGGAILIMAWAVSGLSLGVGLTLAYFMMAANNIPHDTLLNEAIPSARRSVMLSIESFAIFVGITLGSFSLGYLASITGPQTGLMVGAIVALLASASYIGVGAALRREGKRIVASKTDITKTLVDITKTRTERVSEKS